MDTAITQKGVFSGFALKRLAVISMLIDHFGSLIMDGVLAPYWGDSGAILFDGTEPFLVLHAFEIKNICEALGSVAFPIFCFLAVEGFLHTRDAVRYGARMGLFALLSEIPFDLAHYEKLFDPKLQNVMFTLCVGIFTLLLVRFIERRFAEKAVLRVICVALAVIAGMLAAFLIRGEYVFLGVAAISLLYLLRGNRRLQLAGLLPLAVASPWSLLAALPIALYSNQRGRGSKYFFYIFYPAHFLVFALIAYLLAGRAL